jgi:hypothetical protein
MKTTYTYQTKKGTNIEEFDSKGYVTLSINGVFIYQHQFSSIGVKMQEIELQKAFVIHGIKFSKNIINN